MDEMICRKAKLSSYVVGSLSVVVIKSKLTDCIFHFVVDISATSFCVLCMGPCYNSLFCILGPADI